MAKVKFNVSPHSDLKSAWGYPIEVTADGVFGEVPADMIEHEAAAGRIIAPVKPVDGRSKEARAAKSVD